MVTGSDWVVDVEQVVGEGPGGGPRGQGEVVLLDDERPMLVEEPEEGRPTGATL